ncbi:MAG: UbiA family prenyltransferase [Thermoanaerobaculia bacterium]
MTARRSHPADTRPAGTPLDYLAMARPAHWTKHALILPGLALAHLLRPAPWMQLLRGVLLGFAAAAALASANYILNEWLDAPSDAHHPIKSRRPAVEKRLSPWGVWGLYAALAGAGLLFAAGVGELFLITAAAFLVSGLVYNVPPWRAKDRAFADVVVEAVNNPIRLTLGWAMVESVRIPPSSLLLAYWMGGGFLMGVKRLAEYRSAVDADGRARLALYRRSFARYSERSLLLSSVLYALLAAFFLAVFLIKYRVEYLLAVPLFAWLFVVYLDLGLEPDSIAQAPERLFRSRRLMVAAALLVVALALLTWVDIPWLARMALPHYLRLPD